MPTGTLQTQQKTHSCCYDVTWYLTCEMHVFIKCKKLFHMGWTTLFSRFDSLHFTLEICVDLWIMHHKSNVSTPHVPIREMVLQVSLTSKMCFTCKRLFSSNVLFCHQRKRNWNLTSIHSYWLNIQKATSFAQKSKRRSTQRVRCCFV